MSLCSLCLDDLEIISENCQDHSPTNMHYSIQCYGNKIYKTICNHKFHKCCIYSYLWHCTGADCEGEIGIIKCPLCNNLLNIKIEN